MAEGVTQEGSPLEVDLQLGDDSRLEGTVRNKGSILLEDVALLMGSHMAYIGALAAGEEKAVQLSVSADVLNPFARSDYRTLLPPPPGVTVQSYGPYYGASSASDEVRRYNRKWNVLESAISKLETYSAPARMEVLAFAWASQRSNDFRVEGGAREEGVTLWASRAYPTNSGNSRLFAGLMPFSIYAPGSTPYWVAGWPRSMPYIPDLQLSPYADITLRMPSGARPHSARCSYRLLEELQGRVSVLAYDPASGDWISVAELANGPEGLVDSNFDIPNPALYTGPAGDLRLRLMAESGKETVSFATLGFGMNEASGQP
jgi:hypothetical protein